MSAIEKIASFQNRHDEVPNQELARELAQSQDRQGLQEIADGLKSKNKDVQADCLKVLYEVGYLRPELVAGYAQNFLDLLKSKNNRLVWGAMIALANIADVNPETVEGAVADIQHSMENGSVITVDNGVKILAILAAKSAERSKAIFPYLIKHLNTCRPKDIPQHAEKILLAVNADNKKEFIAVLEKRMEQMSAPQMSRAKKIIRAAEKR